MKSNYLNSEQTCQYLQIKKKTLYSYVSRGLIRCKTIQGSNQKLYFQPDLNRIKTKGTIKKGHKGVHLNALDFGFPIIYTSICEITDAGPYYRGVPLSYFLNTNATFETVYQHLVHKQRYHGKNINYQGHTYTTEFRELLTVDNFSKIHKTNIFKQYQYLISRILFEHYGHCDSEDIILDILHFLASGHKDLSMNCSLSEQICSTSPHLQNSQDIINKSLILCMEHELGVSSFACRIAASTNSNLLSCILSGISSHSGQRQGNVFRPLSIWFERYKLNPDQFLLEEENFVKIPGFNHPLYPKGDPRAYFFLELCDSFPVNSDYHHLQTVLQYIKSKKLGTISMEFGLFALSKILGQGIEFCEKIFLLARTAGWIAHIYEQRQSSQMLRPRAQYVKDNIK